MRLFSLFSGVGGFEIGMPSHFSQVGFSEIDKHASAVLKYRYPSVPNYGDITKIGWSTVPDFDLLVGGSPCQDLSVAGRRKGLGGERSGLFHEYVRALQEKKPQYFIWENVKGALSSNGGRDFAVVLDALAEAGYSLWWQVLNAKDFGVPQNRERIFVVGTRNGSSREVFFEREGNARCTQVINAPKHSNNRLYDAGGIAPTLNTAQGGNRQPKVIATGINHPSRGVELREDGIAAAIKSGQSGSQRPKVAIAPTLRANHHNTADVHFIGEIPKIRRLTPVECERLMSWPDDHTKYGDYGDGVAKEISDSQRYKMCGNGVVSAVVKEVVEKHVI